MNRYLTRCQPSPADLLAQLRSSARLSGYRRLGAIALFSVVVAGFSHLPAHTQENSPAAAPQSPVTEPDSRSVLQLGSQGAAVAQLQAVLKLLGYYSGAIDGVYQESTAQAVAAFQQVAGLQSDGVAGIETWNRLLPAPPPLSSTTATAPTAPAATAAPRPAAPTASPAATPPNPGTAPAAPQTGSSSFPTPTAASASTSARPNFPAPTATPAPAAALAPTPTATPTPAPSTAGYTPAPTAAASPAPTSSANSTDLPVLRLGMQGAAVTRLQEQLKAIGLFTGAVDGVFGTETEIAVQEAQRNYNLEPDGVVGPATWAALLQRR